MQVAIWKRYHTNEPDVPKPSEENDCTKNQNEVLEPLWTTGDVLHTNLTDIVGRKNVGENDDDKLNLCDDTSWGSDKYDTEIAFDVDSENNFDDWTKNWFKIGANVFQENAIFVDDFVICFSFT